MSNHRTEADIRAAINQAEAAQDRLAGQLADLDARRAEVEHDRKKAGRRAADLRAELQARLEEPQKAKQLEAALTSLDARIASATHARDRRSPTLASVKEKLAALRADKTATSAEKLARVEDLARAFTERIMRDQRQWDASERKAAR